MSKLEVGRVRGGLAPSLSSAVGRDIFSLGLRSGLCVWRSRVEVLGGRLVCRGLVVVTRR